MFLELFLHLLGRELMHCTIILALIPNIKLPQLEFVQYRLTGNWICCFDFSSTFSEADTLAGISDKYDFIAIFEESALLSIYLPLFLSIIRQLQETAQCRLFRAANGARS